MRQMPLLCYRLTVAATIAWLNPPAPMQCDAETIDVKSLKTIWMPKEDAAPEQAAAKVLQEGFQSLYGFRPTVLASPPAGGAPGILLGRRSRWPLAK